MNQSDSTSTPSIFGTYQSTFENVTLKAMPSLYAELRSLLVKQEHPLLKDMLQFGSATIYLLNNKEDNVIICKVFNLVEIFYIKKISFTLENFIKNEDISVGFAKRCFVLSTNKKFLSKQQWDTFKQEESTVISGFSSYCSMLAQIYLKDERLFEKKSKTLDFELLEISQGSLGYAASLKTLISPLDQGTIIEDILYFNEVLSSQFTPKILNVVSTLVEKVFEVCSLKAHSKALTFNDFSITCSSTELTISQDTGKYIIRRDNATNIYRIYFCSRFFAGASSLNKIATCSSLKYLSLVLETAPQKILYTGGYLDELFEVLSKALLPQSSVV